LLRKSDTDASLSLVLASGMQRSRRKLYRMGD
jgi:hypothetical protein